MRQTYNLPEVKYRSVRWAEVHWRTYEDPALILEHCTSTHPENRGAYLIAPLPTR